MIWCLRQWFLSRRRQRSLRCVLAFLGRSNHVSVLLPYFQRHLCVKCFCGGHHWAPGYVDPWCGEDGRGWSICPCHESGLLIQSSCSRSRSHREDLLVGSLRGSLLVGWTRTRDSTLRTLYESSPENIVSNQIHAGTWTEMKPLWLPISIHTSALVIRQLTAHPVG